MLSRFISWICYLLYISLISCGSSAVSCDFIFHCLTCLFFIFISRYSSKRMKVVHENELFIVLVVHACLLWAKDRKMDSCDNEDHEKKKVSFTKWIVVHRGFHQSSIVRAHPVYCSWKIDERDLDVSSSWFLHSSRDSLFLSFLYLANPPWAIVHDFLVLKS